MDAKGIKKELGQFIGFGLLIGIAIGVATDNVGLGIALGLIFGAGTGTVISKRGGR